MKQADLFQPSVPWQPRSHASFTGAQVASRHKDSQQARLLAVIQARGPITQADLVKLTGYPINVVTARVRALVLEGRVRADGFQAGPSGAKRTLWKALTAQEQFDAR